METLTEIDFDEFHQSVLPKRLAKGNGKLAAGTSEPGRSFAWHLTDGRAATYLITEDGVEIRSGDQDADVVVEVPPEDWQMYALEMKSCFALLYTDVIRMWRGEFDHFAAWEPTLLAAYFGRKLYERVPRMKGIDGDKLDITQSFDWQDLAGTGGGQGSGTASTATSASHFFRTAGFLHIKNVFTPGEVAAFSAIAREAINRAHPEDNRSWWATHQDGSQVCCRVTYLNEKYPTILSLKDDERLQRIADLSGEQLLPNPDRLDGYSVVIKNGQIKEGLSDLPWHRDCGMGGHPVLCPGVNIGIQLDTASAKNGQLHFLAGSHNHSNRDNKVRKNWPIRAVEAQAGDVTAHFGHVLHYAPPPKVLGQGRKVLYAGFKKAELDDFVPVGQGYNDVLFQHDSGRIRSPEEVQAARDEERDNYFDKGSYDPHNESDYTDKEGEPKKLAGRRVSSGKRVRSY